MKKFYYILSLLVFCLAFFMACTEDEGNYSYLSEEEVGLIKIDTTGMGIQRFALTYNMNPGDTIVFDPNVSYKYPERLRYRWFYLTLHNYQYQAVQVGNKLVFPPADTIGYTKKLDWICNLEPGAYRFYLLVEDSVSGVRAYYQAEEQYVSVNQSGSQKGLYLLTETTDGNTDIEVLTSTLQLVTGGDAQYFHYYSDVTGHTLPGKPRFIRGATDGASKSAYLVVTDQNMWRLNSVGMQTMDDWNTMFYDTPEVFDPQCSFYNSSYGKCDFLINNGKLHVLYTDKANDRKYSAPIAGDYEAAPFLMLQTKTTWGAVSGAINADQVIYDQKNRCFRPYFPRESSLSNFRATAEDAYLDANALPADPVAIFTGNGYDTYAILLLDGVPYLYRYCFYNRVDNGDLSTLNNGGERSALNLSGCMEIKNAKYYAANSSGSAFYYATDKGVYSFSPTSGQTTSRTIYECEADETVTAIYAPGSVGGGWPTSSCCFYVALWNSSTQEGKVLEYEMNHNDGVPESYWGPMFGGDGENPVATTGWGKIVSMTWIDAE